MGVKRASVRGAANRISVTCKRVGKINKSTEDNRSQISFCQRKQLHTQQGRKLECSCGVGGSWSYLYECSFQHAEREKCIYTDIETNAEPNVWCSTKLLSKGRLWVRFSHEETKFYFRHSVTRITGSLLYHYFST